SGVWSSPSYRKRSPARSVEWSCGPTSTICTPTPKPPRPVSTPTPSSPSAKPPERPLLLGALLYTSAPSKGVRVAWHDRVDRKVLGGAFGTESAAATHSVTFGIEFRQRRAGDQYLAACRGIRHPCGD